MLPATEQSEFDRTGVLHVKSLLSGDAIAYARDAILKRFEALGLAKGCEWQLAGRPKAKWPDKGYSAKAIGNKIIEVERLLGAPNVKPIAQNLLSTSDFDSEFFKRPQILVTLPQAGDWFMPQDGWHVDIARVPSGRRPGVQVFILLSDIKSQGGGTLVVAGSHRLLNDGHFIRSSDVTKRLRRDVSFREATSGASSSGGDHDLKTVELTGAPGDAYFMDMRCVHSASPNMADQPRMMVTHRFLRADIMPELLASQYGMP